MNPAPAMTAADLILDFAEQYEREHGELPMPTEIAAGIGRSQCYVNAEIRKRASLVPLRLDTRVATLEAETGQKWYRTDEAARWLTVRGHKITAGRVQKWICTGRNLPNAIKRWGVQLIPESDLVAFVSDCDAYEERRVEQLRANGQKGGGLYKHPPAACIRCKLVGTTLDEFGFCPLCQYEIRTKRTWFYPRTIQPVTSRIGVMRA